MVVEVVLGLGAGAGGGGIAEAGAIEAEAIGSCGVEDAGEGEGCLPDGLAWCEVVLGDKGLDELDLPAGAGGCGAAGEGMGCA